MVNHISISNFAIIENTEINFEEGLNIITGETGSGKSIVIEAISLALGSRADSGLVRHGSDKAVVQLAGELEGEEIVITREVSSSGKNLCKLNGNIVTLGELTHTCKKMADIHGQYDNQSLLNVDNHLKLVDEFGHETIVPIKDTYSLQFEKYQDAKKKLHRLISAEKENARKLDFYRFEKNEIEKASLTVGEDDNLEDTISILQNSEKIYAALENTYSLLNEGDPGITVSMGSAMRFLDSISEYSKDVAKVSEQLGDMYYQLEDIVTSVRSLKENITFAPDELDKAIQRLDLIDGLKKKYGNTIEEILSYYENISEELEQMENLDEAKAVLEAACQQALANLKNTAHLLSEARKHSASLLSEHILEELHQLNFSDADLKIEFRLSDELTANGQDFPEIMLTTNRGEPMKPLTKIASGGEISRIMLAIKKVTGTFDNIPTMIFDEIDSGISGVTASIVGRKLKQISKKHQIICITHLPQIAAAGDYNFRIFKDTNGDSTFTHVEKLSSAEKVNEIARLLGGDNITETTLKSSKELIDAV